MSAFPHYFKPLPLGCTHIDVYRVLSLFEVSDPALQHAIKKLLCAGARGAKDQAQDIAEAIATLQRWQQMREEEQPAPAAEPTLRDDVERIRAVFAELPREHLDAAMDWMRSEREEDPEEDPTPAPADAERRFGPATSDPADAERNIRAKEDAERAAYLARWKDAPEWAHWRTKDERGNVFWLQFVPLCGTRDGEPRPVQGVGS